MAQEVLKASEQGVDESGMVVGLTYPDETTAVDAVLVWGSKFLCPLAKSRREKGLDETEGLKRGRRYLDCPHGRKRVAKTKGERKSQNVKFTKCPVSIVITENMDKTWTITKVILEHFGHVVTEKEYYRHSQNRKLDEEEKDYLKELIKTKAITKNMAACLSRKTGKEFNSKDVSNLMQRLKSANPNEPNAESVLGKIQDDGGFVRYSRDSHGFVDVLFVQTA